ncbi:MAG: cation:proton antiporter [Thermoplasmata archaeon]|nr:cation:proton antiporter [Thermoplasmata archaeon]
MLELNLILYLGIALVIGFLLGKATNWLKLTAIIGYIFAGIILGPVLGLITEDALGTNSVQITVDVTLGLVGFIIGVGFTKNFLRRYGKMSIAIAVIQSIVTFTIILVGIYILTLDLSLSLILGVIGLATAPAGTVAAIHMCRGRGKLTRMTLAVVGLDDGIAVIFFVIILAIVKVQMGGSFSALELIRVPLVEIGGAIAIGILIGAALAYMSKSLAHKEDVFIVALSFIILAIGICEAIGASFILACMILGVVFINLSPRMGKTTQITIETILAPIFILFFAIAGLEINFELFNPSEVIGTISIIVVILIYIIYRTMGKIFGGLLAGKSTNAPPKIRKYLGFALLSQAGVAIGFAILVRSELGSELGSAGVTLGTIVITIIAITTIFFEIIGPIGVRYALTKAGEAHDV